MVISLDRGRLERHVFENRCYRAGVQPKRVESADQNELHSTRKTNLVEQNSHSPRSA